MKYSVSLHFMWPELSLPERARRAADHGFDRVDLWDWRGEDIDELAGTCGDLGLEISGFFGTRLALVDPDARGDLLASLAESVEVAERVGARQLHMFSNQIGAGGAISKPPPLTRSAQYQSCVDGLAEAVKLVEGKPMQLVLESINDVHVPGYFWNSTGIVIALCRALDHPQVRLSFDCFHQQLSGGRLTDNLVESLSYATRVDIADVPGRHQPGTGEINFHHIRDVLDEHRFDGQITFETVPAGGDSEAAIAACKRVFAF